MAWINFILITLKLLIGKRSAISDQRSAISDQRSAISGQRLAHATPNSDQPLAVGQAT
ncbi:MAG: hypothetical protein F6K56_45910 [Moorea sp. SIO3G5]|nr:hypothetical protein [Moorena sp. SIO3G5]